MEKVEKPSSSCTLVPSPTLFLLRRGLATKEVDGREPEGKPEGTRKRRSTEGARAFMTLAFNEPKYEIEVSGFRCHACQAEIPCEAHYFSAVFYEEEAFRRRDYCVSCWRASGPASGSAKAPPPAQGAGSSEALVPGKAAAAAEDGVFAFWRARRPPLPSDEPKRVRFDPELLLQFFRRVGGEAGLKENAAEKDQDQTKDNKDNQDNQDEVKFVLALLLIRKKLLTFVSSGNRDGVEWLKLSEKKDPGQVHWVRNPDLNDSRIEKVKDTLGSLLQMRL
jgi:hypothetical protein